MIGEDARRAEDEWRTTLDHGGAIVWTATLYDVDTKSYFVMAFDREALRVYRFGELAGTFNIHLGIPQFPGGDRERLWRAWDQERVRRTLVNFVDPDERIVLPKASRSAGW